MIQQINDGGPAFPSPFGGDSDKWWSAEQDGMSLRDWFAGQLPEFFSNATEPAWASKVTGVPLPADPTDSIASTIFWANAEAVMRYRRADAMLKAREVTK